MGNSEKKYKHDREIQSGNEAQPTRPMRNHHHTAQAIVERAISSRGTDFEAFFAFG
jgi:hypothetical protein